jgi:sugar/nucleoside kinase (ribokinase family)
MISLADLLSINLDEAASFAEAPLDFNRPIPIIEAAVQKILRLNPQALLAVTAGRRGSWFWDGKELAHQPALPVEVIGTAGAGDAHFAGMLAALGAGLPLFQAHELARLTAALSVTSPHTINREISPGALLRFASNLGLPLPTALQGFLISRAEKEPLNMDPS